MPSTDHPLHIHFTPDGVAEYTTMLVMFRDAIAQLKQIEASLPGRDIESWNRLITASEQIERDIVRLIDFVNEYSAARNEKPGV